MPEMAVAFKSWSPKEENVKKTSFTSRRGNAWPEEDRRGNRNNSFLSLTGYFHSLIKHLHTRTLQTFAESLRVREGGEGLTPTNPIE